MRTYCFKTCISISHSNSYEREKAHIHTVEVTSFVKYQDAQTDLKKFDDVEVIIDSCFLPYQECYLNDMKGFEENVSIEHFGEILFFELDEMLNTNGMFLEKFEISETPLRTYIITRTI